MMLRGISTIMACWLIVLVMGPAPAVADELDAIYEQLFGQQEREARSREQRVALAGELLQHAKSGGQEDFKAMLCRKAYEWGSRNTDGYQHAADALNLLQRISPDERIWCLERLLDLYDSAYQRNPKKLRLGTGMAEVLMELAEQRVENAQLAFETGQNTAAQTAAAFDQARRDAARARSVYDGAIRRAESDARLVRRHKRADLAQSLEAFVTEFTPIRQQTEDRMHQLADELRDWMQLASVHKRFTITADEQSATQIASTYIMSFDRPELIEADVRGKLPAPVRQAVGLSCKPLVEIESDAAAALASWYLDLSSQATELGARQDLLTRAQLYAHRAKALGSDQIDSLQSRLKLHLLANQLGDDEAIGRRVEKLHARLHYQFGSGEGEPPALAAGSAEVPPVATQPSTAEPQPDAVAAEDDAADDGPPPDALADATNGSTSPEADTTQRRGTRRASASGPTARSGRADGRPMTTCQTCGRKFFAGWGVEAHNCARCAQGRGSIFDMDSK